MAHPSRRAADNKAKGRKPHRVVNTVGLPLAATSAAVSVVEPEAANAWWPSGGIRA